MAGHIDIADPNFGGDRLFANQEDHLLLASITSLDLGGERSIRGNRRRIADLRARYS